MELKPFRAEHVNAMQEQDATRWLSTYLDEANLRMLESHPSYTGFVDGQVVGCGGVVKLWQGRGEVWVILGENAGKHFRRIHKETQKFINNLDLRRVELVVDATFNRAHKWARMLGFELERDRMPAYFPDGRDAAMYVRLT